MITFSKLGRYGQLGNQMFQLALLIGVAAKKGYEIAIPPGGKIKKKDKVELYDCFDLHIPTLWKSGRLRCKYPYLYESLKFEPRVFEQPDYTDFIGYYQSEKYFEHAEAEVRKQFTFNAEIRDLVKRVTGTWRRQSECLVAIHARRGDYLEHPNNFTVLSPEYIRRAMDYFPRNCRFMVFSDDMPWCLENIKGDNVEHVQGFNHYQDLALMAACDHFIISASSFSWWAAWLSKNRIKRVVAPMPWFPATANIDTSDVCPESWIKLEV